MNFGERLIIAICADVTGPKKRGDKLNTFRCIKSDGKDGMGLGTATDRMVINHM